MKRLALAISVLAVTATGALANPVYNWTGFYIGGNVGYSWGRSASTLWFTDAGATVSSANTRNDMNGVIGGGQLGYNWQFDNKWVFGLEADFQGSDQKGGAGGACAGGALTAVATLNSACSTGHIGDTTPFNVAALPVTSEISQKLNWFGTVRGRIGPTVTPTVLVYVTGGLAYGEVTTTNAVAGTNITGAQGTNVFALTPVAGSANSTTTRVGWTIGAGIEGVVSGNWTARLEYLYVDLGDVSGSFVTPVTGLSGGLLTSRYSSHITDNILRVGLNYRWAAR
ncbi:outer membrane immunogenic protein [Bradyrhizobium sp. AZCC 2262]|uniref:outer membrane protein n=1 Tax=Bradyrhizobium sp. AZCC 2262 TaxID=3117022 RepID=UPI002FF1524C